MNQRPSSRLAARAPEKARAQRLLALLGLLLAGGVLLASPDVALADGGEVPAPPAAKAPGTVAPASPAATPPTSPTPESIERGASVRDVQVSRRAPPRLRAALKALLNAPALQDAEVSFHVSSLASKEGLASSGADALINPASNAKLFTTAAALKLLKPEFRFRTYYYTRGRIKDGVLWGDLIVKGGGDPTVVTERLQRVANEIYLLGIQRIRGNIIVDASYFDGDMLPAGWEMEENPDRAYAAPISGLSLNYNAVGIHVRPGERNTPAIVSIDPAVGYVTLQGEVQTKRWGRRLRISTKPDRDTTVVEVSGAVGYRAQPRRWYRRVYDPPLYFGSALAHFLRMRGVRVKNRIVKGTVPPGARLIHVDASPRLTRITSDLNHFSNNFIAETLVKTIAAEATGEPGSFATGLAIVREFLETEVGLEPGSYVYGNGSGLNDVNRFSAAQVVKLLEFMSADFEIGPEFVNSLAVAGTQGTIGFRMKHGPAKRRIRAKTGTLTGVSALSGFVVNPRNEVLTFSILVQGYKGRVSPIWDIQNQIGEALASDGETWAPTAVEPVATEATVLIPPNIEPAKGGAP